MILLLLYQIGKGLTSAKKNTSHKLINSLTFRRLKYQFLITVNTDKDSVIYFFFPYRN